MYQVVHFCTLILSMTQRHLYFYIRTPRADKPHAKNEARSYRAFFQPITPRSKSVKSLFHRAKNKSRDFSLTAEFRVNTLGEREKEKISFLAD